MKKILICSIIALFLLGPLGAAANKKQTMESIYQFYNRREYTQCLELIEKALNTYGTDNELLQLKYKILMSQKKYGEALAFIDKEIKKSGETEELLAAKYNILFLQGDLPGALDAARKKYNMAKTKSPWDCINIMHVYLRMNSKNDALDWLQEAVKNGFISFRLLDDKKYALLDNDSRFYEIIESMKMSAGLGYPAKKLSITLLSGDTFTLTSQRGKVVIIYFWATWCDPCRLEIPYLDQLFRDFKDKGVELVCISLDTGSTGLSRLDEFIKSNKLEGKQACSGNGWVDDTVKQYGVNTLPSLWVVDKKGFLRSFDVKGKELQQVISTLIAE